MTPPPVQSLVLPTPGVDVEASRVAELAATTSRPFVWGHATSLFVDLFCGFGGVTAGWKRAMARMGLQIGTDADAACVNHNEDALAGHKANNPDCLHVQCDLETKNPREVCRTTPDFPSGHLCEACRDLDVTIPCPRTGNVGRKITGLWTSAPCQQHSPANRTRRRNGKRRARSKTSRRAPRPPYSRPQDRATPDYNHEWRRVGEPDWIIEENVEGIRRWRGWKKHLASYKADGYHAEHKILNAADFSVPQARRRVILIAVKISVFGDGPIPWIEPTHCDPRKPVDGRAPWVGAISCIDFDEWAPSFFDGKKDSLGRATGQPYSPMVRARIAQFVRDRGRFWHPLAKAIETFSGPVPLKDALEACPREEWPRGLSMPDADTVVFEGFDAPDCLVSQYDEGKCRPLEEASMTLTSAGYVRFAQVRAILPGRGRHGGDLANPAYHPSEASHVVLAGRDHGHVLEARIHLTGAAIIPHHGEDTKRGQPPRYHDMAKPSCTVPATRALDAAFPFVVTYNGGYGKGPGVRGVDDALSTISTRPRHFIATPRIVAKLGECFLDMGYRIVKVIEAALLQGFARIVKLIGPIRVQQRGVGNAVPPPLAEAVIYGVHSRLLALRSVHA